MKLSGMNGDTTKHLNRQQVLRMLSMEPGISRTEIAARMGLVKMTVSNIISEMLRSKMICESRTSAHQKQGAGRKLTGLCFSDTAPAAAGLWLEGDCLHAGIFSMELKLLQQFTCQIDPASVVRDMADAVSSLAHSSGRTLLGIGLALSSDWDLSLQKALSEKTGLPVFAAADAAADIAVISRYADYERFVCLTLSSSEAAPAADGGLRAGIMAGGIPLGDPGGCVPFGQMTCRSGKLADLVSIPALCGRTCDLTGIECHTLADVQNVCCNAPNGAEILQTLFDPLADTVFNLCLIARPETLILGGGFNGFGQALREYLFSRLHSRLGERTPAVTAFRLGSDTTFYGAACLVLEQVFTGALGYELFFQE